MTRPPSEAPEIRLVCENRRARRDYTIEETFEAGMALLGSEVKSLRAGHAQLKDAYCTIEGGEVFLVGAHISAYEQASLLNHPPERRRKLLLHAREIQRLSTRVRERGQTVIPLRIYFRGPHAKVEIALTRGRAQRDRRDEIRRRDLDRELERERRSRER